MSPARYDYVRPRHPRGPILARYGLCFQFSPAAGGSCVAAKTSTIFKTAHCGTANIYRRQEKPNGPSESARTDVNFVNFTVRRCAVVFNRLINHLPRTFQKRSVVLFKTISKATRWMAVPPVNGFHGKGGPKTCKKLNITTINSSFRLRSSRKKSIINKYNLAFPML